MQDDTEQSLDDAMAELGLDTKPATREEELYVILTEGKHPKMASCRYWLMHEMAKFKFLTGESIKVSKSVVREGKLVDAPLTNLEYAKLCLKLYLQMYHLTYFMELNPGDKVADMNKVIDLMLEYGDFKVVIEKYGS